MDSNIHHQQQQQPNLYDFSDEFNAAIKGLQCLLAPQYLRSVECAAELLANAIRSGKKILICGNGGSAADAQHIAAELVGRYKAERRALPAIALTTDSSVLTAWSNDYTYDTVFSRQVDALAQAGDVVWGISTSGRSRNVVAAVEAAKRIGAHSLGMLGRDGGELAVLTDVAVIVELQDTARIQEAHQVTYHAICGFLDHAFEKLT